MNQLPSFMEEFCVDGQALEDLGTEFWKDKRNWFTSASDEEWTGFLSLMQEKLDELMKYPSQQESLKVYEPYVDVPTDRKELALFYHRKTWNMKGKGARSQPRSGWGNQPAIHRRWFGSKHFPLSVEHCGNLGNTPKYNDLWMGTLKSKNLDARSLSEFFYFSLACSSRKESGSIAMHPKSSWSKRCNASSGGLHPVECHIIGKPAELGTGLTHGFGCYHYSCKEHALEERTVFPVECFKELPENSFLLFISSVDWREVWKYGERGFRYVQLDIGHALGSLVVSALMQGWKITPLNTQNDCAEYLTDEALENLLGLSIDIPEDIERIGLALLVTPSQTEVTGNIRTNIRDGIVKASAISKQSTWSGVPSKIGGAHYQWDIVEAVTEATRNVGRTSRSVSTSLLQTQPKLDLLSEKLSGDVIRYRRSSVSMRNSLSSQVAKLRKRDFFGILAKTVPSLNPAFWSTCHGWDLNINIGLYVIDVEDVSPGYYILARNTSVDDLRKTISGSEKFEWKQCDDSLPLYFLRDREAASVGEVSQDVSCVQAIARSTAFTLSMFAPLESLLEQDPSVYRQAHWECGFLGQLLYLEATSLGYGASGMGCFLDDIALESFGVPNTDNGGQLTPLYHFTIGHAVPDDRYPPFNYDVSMSSLVRQFLI
eukprot:TRINITY_DN3713_c0_g1_i1.p1 TRINITY_DN3713_c0_g1~~TRINITY_DN3713_c0_g1_i1.p1  ORF type:complete len:710 (+),score=95.02 TRINITY_DN3713_c0_g1_i1:164-2131(+)